MKKAAFLLAFAFIVLSQATLTNNLIVPSEANIGDKMFVQMQLSTDAADEINESQCSVFVYNKYSNVFFSSIYDSILNEPPSMKTNNGGYAYVEVPLGNNFILGNYTVIADCNGIRNSSTVYISPYAAGSDWLFGQLLSIKWNIGTYLIAFFIAIVIIALGKYLVDRLH